MDERFRKALRDFNADPLVGYERLHTVARRLGINLDGGLIRLPPFLTAVCSQTGERMWNRGINEAAPGHYHFDSNRDIRSVCQAPLTVGLQDIRMIEGQIVENLFTARQRISNELVEQATPEDRLILLMAAFDDRMNSKGPGYIYFREQVENRLTESFAPVIEFLTEMY